MHHPSTSRKVTISGVAHHHAVVAGVGRLYHNFDPPFNNTNLFPRNTMFWATYA